jgi:hypothetical protein
VIHQRNDVKKLELFLSARVLIPFYAQCKLYVQYFRAANIDLSRYLFDKRIRALRLVFSFLCPPTPYDVHKKNLVIYDGELPHSFWSGTATMLQRLGAPQEDITRHVGWQSTQMVGLYAPKDKVLGISSSPPTPAALICTMRY